MAAGRQGQSDARPDRGIRQQGGHTRTKNLTPEQRSAIAHKASLAAAAARKKRKNEKEKEQ